MKNTFATIKFWMDKILSIACAILLSFMTILVLIQVFTRFVLNNPVAFTEELVRYSLIWTSGCARKSPYMERLPCIRMRIGTWIAIIRAMCCTFPMQTLKSCWGIPSRMAKPKLTAI